MFGLQQVMICVAWAVILFVNYYVAVENERSGIVRVGLHKVPCQKKTRLTRTADGCANVACSCSRLEVKKMSPNILYLSFPLSFRQLKFAKTNF